MNKKINFTIIILIINTLASGYIGFKLGENGYISNQKPDFLSGYQEDVSLSSNSTNQTSLNNTNNHESSNSQTEKNAQNTRSQISELGHSSESFTHLARINQNKHTPEQQQRLNDYARQLENQDFNALIEKMQDEDPEQLLTSDLIYLIKSKIKEIPELTGSRISSLPSGVIKASLAQEYAFELSSQSPEQALEWANTLIEPEIQQQAERMALSAWVDQEPFTAMIHIADHYELAAYQDVLERGTHALASRMPAQVAMNMHNFPNVLHPLIAYSVASQWNQTEPDSARQWVENLPQGPTRDQALLALIDVTSTEQLSEDPSYLKEVSDPKTRIKASHRVAQRLFRNDPQKADAYLSNLNLLSSDEQTLLTTCRTLMN